jgi:hypothetical protein
MSLITQLSELEKLNVTLKNNALFGTNEPLPEGILDNPIFAAINEATGGGGDTPVLLDKTLTILRFEEYNLPSEKFLLTLVELDENLNYIKEGNMVKTSIIATEFTRNTNEDGYVLSELDIKIKPGIYNYQWLGDFKFNGDLGLYFRNAIIGGEPDTFFSDIIKIDENGDTFQFETMTQEFRPKNLERVPTRLTN